MKYTAEHKGFILYIEEVQEEGKDICFEGKCKELKYFDRQWFYSGFFRLIGKFQHEVDTLTTKKEEELMTQHYLVKYSSNWADEMYIKGLALLTEEDKSRIESLISKRSSYPLTHHVGTNEDIEYFGPGELIRRYTWTPITEDEYKTLHKLIGSDYGHFYYPEVEDEEEEEIDDDDIYKDYLEEMEPDDDNCWVEYPTVEE